MSRLPGQLQDVPLWDLAIPGSHDSMSFCLDVSSPLLGSEPRLLRLADRLAPCWARPCVSRWATTQEALQELSVWLDAHPREVVIVSCSHFESLSDEDHLDLAVFILGLFGHKLRPPAGEPAAPTLRSCWSRGQQLVVCYDDLRVALRFPQLWTGIPYWYADSSDPRKVISYLEAKKSGARPGRTLGGASAAAEGWPFLTRVCTFTSWLLRVRPEPDGERGLRPAPPAPDHEDHDHEGPAAAAHLGQQTEARGSGGRSQRAVLRLRGRSRLLLAGDWAEPQTAGPRRGPRAAGVSPAFPRCSEVLTGPSWSGDPLGPLPSHHWGGCSSHLSVSPSKVV
ncbi:unnamed protein product [Tetraodon nigroviridis]|uniref:(spotted green pufferfish) hypothetical protein n=1 Tax=Tetraodon nigroviridis TaxID=99883 RepID=Q4RMT2_TETNG|nr:unnamed protein product [Tetraodon nigroviridis]